MHRSRCEIAQLLNDLLDVAGFSFGGVFQHEPDLVVDAGGVYGGLSKRCAERED
jgi:hypothetical protein